MRVDSASRSFFALLAVALGPYLVLGMFACGSLSVAAYELVAGDDTAVAAGAMGWVAVGFLAIAGIGVLAALRSLWQQSAATRRLAAHVLAHRREVPARVADAAARNRISRIELVASDQPYAFTYGLLAPRVVISTGLLTATTAKELDAVLAHERYHVATLDPLKTLIARVIPAAFFFLPALRHLGRRYFASRELAADRRAARRSGTASLAGALYKTAAGSASPRLVASAAAMGGNDLLDVRITQLEAGHEPSLPTVPHRIMAITGAGLALSAIGIVATIAAADTGAAQPGVAGEVLGAAVCAAAWLVGATFVYGHLAARR